MANNQYDPDVYKRLELVRKQFKQSAAEQKKQETAARNQRVLSSLGENKAKIVRISALAVVGIILIAVVATRVSEVFMK